MTHEQSIIKRDLLNLPTTLFITKWFFDTCPFVFESNPEFYREWRHLFSAKVNIDPSDIILTGSASIGFSLSPYKNFKPFDENSDIDICIFSDYYFTISWHDLLNIHLNNFSYKYKTKIKEHREKYIYWGTIATDTILPILSFGPTWERIIPQINNYPKLKDHNIHFRIYKDRQSFRNYSIQSMEKTKNTLMEVLTNA